MNTIDIRNGKQSDIEAIRFSEGSYYSAVAIAGEGGDLVIMTEDDLADEGGLTINKEDVPTFFAAIRKGIELGWFPAFEPAPAKATAAKKTAAKKAPAKKK